MSRIERVEYTPASVRDTLVQMKDISELMIDLAYASALENDRGLAEEVIELEKRVDSLIYILQMNLMVAVRSPDAAESLVGVARVASLANNISDAAADIAEIVLHDIGVHPIVREVFQQTEEHLTRLEVHEDSTLTGKTVDDLDLASKIGSDIMAIRRGKNWIINPEKEIIMPEDILVARGTPWGLKILEEAAKGESHELD